MTEDIQETLAKIQPGEIVEVLHKDIKAKSM
jgi:TusA-related sulfurtransferase